jgi:RNA polymerase sigma-70 factor (ECF subfamily)
LEKPGEYNRECELIEKISSGDRAAMRAFYDSYSGYLTAVCSRYVTGADDVKDVLQESFIRIFGSIGRFEYRGPGALRAWAAKIVVNEALKHLRDSRKMRLAVAADGWYEREEEDMPELAEVPAGAIMDMIRSLPEGYRTVFNLYVFEQKSHREIASMLSIAENSSASQLHRARNALAKLIKEYGSKKKNIYG